MGSDSSIQPPSCPPSNEVWVKEEPVHIWPKEEPTDVEMQPTPMVDQPTVPLADSTLQPAPLTDAFFASPEMWISSLPSEFLQFVAPCKEITSPKCLCRTAVTHRAARTRDFFVFFNHARSWPILTCMQYLYVCPWRTLTFHKPAGTHQL